MNFSAEIASNVSRAADFGAHAGFSSAVKQNFLRCLNRPNTIPPLGHRRINSAFLKWKGNHHARTRCLFSRGSFVQRHARGSRGR
jgi:hypothetical protein